MSNKKDRLVAEDEAFVTLIRVAQEDADVRNQLLAILSLDRFNRESVLNTLVDDLRLKEAPKELVSAIASLLDDDVAKKTLEILKGKDPNTTG
ncbi:MAG: hypothetical protein JSV60_05425 [Desulfobacterales bacterium]|nr:MAG: hypothetical protein JSV60_05425 [Desulfobacterales bacterium]